MGTSSNEFLIFVVCVLGGGGHPAFNAGFPTSLYILIVLICVVSVCESVRGTGKSDWLTAFIFFDIRRNIN